jgi:hypothetical protein
MRNLFFLLLILTATGLTALAQEQRARQAENALANSKKRLVAADTLGVDTTARKDQEHILKTIQDQVVEAGKNVANAPRKLKDQSVGQLKMLQAITAKDTTANDSTRTNRAGTAIKSEAGKAKEKVVTKTNTAVENSRGQINSITGSSSKVKDVDKNALEKKGTSLANESVQSDAVNDVKEIRENAKGDVSAVNKEAVTSKLESALPDTTSIRQITGDKNRQVLDEKAMKLQFDSQDADNAPWKTNPYSKDDLKDFNVPGISSTGVSDPDAKVAGYRDKVESIKSPAVTAEAIEKARESAAKSLKQNSISTFADSLSNAREALASKNIKEQLLGAKRIYSEKYLDKLYDSLGVGGIDSLVNTASTLLKTETGKHDLLDKLNQAIAGKEMDGVGYDAEKQGLKMAEYEKLSALEKGDLSDLQLQDAVLAELPPLAASYIDSKYLAYIDSLRDIALKGKSYMLDEKQVTEEMKKAALKERPKFLDKVQFEGIIGFFRDTTVSVFQLTPALSYRFADFISVGAGPQLSVQLENRKPHVEAGFRSFIKGEVWKQRAYLQVEDNINKSRVDTEIRYKSLRHEFLGGGGVLLPISKTLAINFAVLYRLNRDPANPKESPWVFRVGLSSIKKK